MENIGIRKCTDYYIYATLYVPQIRCLYFTFFAFTKYNYNNIYTISGDYKTRAVHSW